MQSVGEGKGETIEFNIMVCKKGLEAAKCDSIYSP